MLLFATVFWGTSFLTQKALVLAQQKLAPGANTWLLTSLSITFRFGLAAIIVAVWKFRLLRGITKLEIYEGLVLGVIGGLGLLFQMDGVNYTTASTSAFLTQCYCIFIPLLVACRKRRWPSKTVTVSTAMVLSGVAILSQFDFRTMRLGRGEIETLIASLFFTAQILWLERPIFSPNNPHRFGIVMFVVSSLVFLPVALAGGNLSHVGPAYSTWPPIAFSLILTFFCTVIAYGIMNYWQRFLPATQAGLIYCAEPVFTSVFALFLPRIFSAFAHIDYPNESLTTHQIVGGGLILGANILVIIRTAQAK